MPEPQHEVLLAFIASDTLPPVGGQRAIDRQSDNSGVHYGAVAEYKGLNGKIEVDNEDLIITHSGFMTMGSGLTKDQPRRVPLQAVSGVRLKEATKLTNNGWLTIGLGGVEPPSLNAMSVQSNAETVMFRYKNMDDFRALHEWLLTVIEHNKTQGIDPSTVEFDAAPSVEVNAAARSEEKMTQMLGDERPDIVAAAARMGWRMGGKRELKKLTEHLHDDETVRLIAQGTYEGNQGILVLTDVRLLFLFHGMVSQGKEDFPLRLISSVQTKAAFGVGELRVFVSGNSSSISGIIKTDLEPLADAVRQGIAEQNAPTAPPPTAPAEPAPSGATIDPFEALQKLAALKDAGVLSEDEFAAKKQEILGRM